MKTIMYSCLFAGFGVLGAMETTMTLALRENRDQVSQELMSIAFTAHSKQIPIEFCLYAGKDVSVDTSLAHGLLDTYQELLQTFPSLNLCMVQGYIRENKRGFNTGKKCIVSLRGLSEKDLDAATLAFVSNLLLHGIERTDQVQ